MYVCWNALSHKALIGFVSVPKSFVLELCDGTDAETRTAPRSRARKGRNLFRPYVVGRGETWIFNPDALGTGHRPQRHLCFSHLCAVPAINLIYEGAPPLQAPAVREGPATL